MVSVSSALRPLIVLETLEMRWSMASIAWAVPPVSEEVRWVRRESIE